MELTLTAFNRYFRIEAWRVQDWPDEDEAPPESADIPTDDLLWIVVPEDD